MIVRAPPREGNLDLDHESQPGGVNFFLLSHHDENMPYSILKLSVHVANSLAHAQLLETNASVIKLELGY
jgi:hypothetical protein